MSTYFYYCLLFSVLFKALCSASGGRVDFRHSSANKAFITSIPGGDYEVVHPFQIRDKNERIGIDTRNYFLKAAEHYQHVTIVIRSNAAGRIKLVLERNNFIFLNRTSFRKLDSSGEHGFSQRVENCYYQGTVAGDASSFVALSSCNGLRGVIAFSNGSTYGVWPLDAGDRGRRHPHILYKTQWSKEARCGASMAPIEHVIRRRVSVKQHSYSDEDSLTYMLEAVNIADLMFSRDLNVRLSVVYAEIWLDVQRIDLFEDIERTMTGVVDYSTGHIYNIAKDASVLFTGGSFANHEAINSVFRSICTARAATIVKAVDVFAAQWTGQMVAQSLGHLLGLEHDTPSCQCDTDFSSQRCIMNDRPGIPGAAFSWQFSKCSIARMHGVWQSGHVQCLLNKPFQPSQLRECGNGVVDGSEECDCGTRETCTDPCCDPLTCTLRAHAQCAAHHQCCHRCELRKAGEVCRNARSACDVAETCDGKSGDCPPDGHLVDGTACGRDGQCWRGNCSDPHNQCQMIWGEGARVAEEECFKQNTRGHEYANCGSSDSSSAYRSCQAEHIRCGTLHCQDGATTPMQAALRAFTFQFQQNEKQVQCKSIANTTVGLVEDGSTCGSGRVCVAGSCVEMSSLCVCFAGWTGVACDTRSNSTLSKNRGTSRTIVVVPSIAEGKTLDTATLLGILLLVGVALLLLLVCLLFCYRRRSVVEIPTPSDEKLDDGIPDQTQRSIKFGNMPSWRDEKRRRKSNKHVYGALNRITEADERDSASLRSRESGSQNAGSQLLFDPNHQVISYGRPEMVIPERIHEHIYAESALIMSNGSPIHLDHPMRSMNSWSKSPSTSIEHIAPTPLRLNNIKQLLRNFQSDDDVGDEFRDENMELLDTRYPLEAYGSTYKPLGDPIGEEELSGVEADHDHGSNTESSRGYELDQRGAEGRLDTGEANSSPVGRSTCDFRQSPSLFNDSFKLEMSSSIHT
ncbi:Disintegrin [Necator americanus]|uniref:Disintegrin n=1 Tax=Necator americanus TaxID=51031 RepID=W2TGG7_NECAM|nr:Disintegrin [Necator americanus]ETN80122.1 Disintegrin [Necator americanus]